MAEIIYHGCVEVEKPDCTGQMADRTENNCYRGTGKIDPRLDLLSHSPKTGFAWGYAGSGPAQLAFAILADYTFNDDLAKALHQQFKIEFIAPIRSDGWLIKGSQVDTFMKPDDQSLHEVVCEILMTLNFIRTHA